MQRVQTDYQPVSKLILAYPERFYNGYDELVPFYDELISLVPEDILIWAVTNNDQSSDKLQDQFSHKQINTLGIRIGISLFFTPVIPLKRINKV